MIDFGSLLGTALDKIFPDADKRNEAKLKMLELQQSGAFKEQEMAIDAIKTEAQSDDPWTSRARPSFMYVIYVFILAAIPFGILSIWYPDQCLKAVKGVKLWLDAIPEDFVWLFGAGYLGYAGARSYDKKNKAKNLKS